MQLNLKYIFERPEKYFPANEIVTRLPDGGCHRYDYGAFCPRVRRLASRLAPLGIAPGEKVATFSWNDFRHLELYFAVPCAGAVLHTVNIRLSDEHVAYILNHARDRAVFVSPDLWPQMVRIAPLLAHVEQFVIMGEEGAALESRVTTAAGEKPVHLYEDLIRDGQADFAFEELDENTPAAMCYTSATTGNPKGVLYSHRGLYLHSLTLGCVDTMAIREADTLMPVAPMFHVNAWGIPFAGVWMGSKIVLPGERPGPDDLLALIEEEKVTFAAGAVTVGIDMLNRLREKTYNLSSLRALMLGGQATPRAVMKEYLEKYGVIIFTAWGATETAPIATTAHIKRHQADADNETKIDIRARQGIPVPGVEVKVLAEGGAPIAWDDDQVGEAFVRGPWVASGYYDDPRSAEGFVGEWWKSGDVAAINGEGVLRLVDRAKDLIKSGGEWISSVDLENALMAHPQVREACVVGAPHEKWLERPVAFVVPQGAPPSPEILGDWLADKFAKWWLPDQYIFVDSVSKTGVGKFNKRLLREQLKEKTPAGSQDPPG